MLTINTNLSSLIVQSNLKTSTNGLKTAIERMTSGFKINHAKDSAANYSISTKLSSQISAYEVAEDNALSGLDMLSTATENLDLIHSHMQRLRDLAEQASNGTYGEYSLKAINSEANAIVDEINRIYENAEYNGQKLFATSLRAMLNPSETVTGTKEAGFIQEITRRDTSGMTKIENVDETTTLAQGTYSISTAEGLVKLATMQNAGLITSDSEFVLTQNIDLKDWCYTNAAAGGWVAIGTDANRFNSNFDGNGYIVSNLNIDRENSNFQGLIGYADGATIQNLAMHNVDILAKNRVGGIVGIALDSLIINCYTTGNISSTSSGGNGYGATGGIAGCLDLGTTVSNCYSEALIKCTSSNWFAGGLIGLLKRSTLSNSYATGSVDGYQYTGGLVGYSESASISNCYATGDVTGVNAYAGGLIGRALGSQIEKTYSNGKLQRNATYTGALIGQCIDWGGSTSSISNSYWDTENSNVSYGLASGDATGVTGVTSSELAALINSGQLPYFSKYSPITPELSLPGGGNGSYVPEIVKLQIGTGTGAHSQISFSVKFSLEGLEDLRNVGLSAPAIATFGLRSGASSIGDIAQCDEILKTIQEKQVEFGATQNRLESALEEIAIKRDNLVSTQSTIRDADIAKESSDYIRNQILQQASATLLATANQTPAIVLQLL